MSGQEKVDASLHNARAAFVDNSDAGSIPSEPPSLIGGGGSVLSNSAFNSIGLPPPPIKERDYCRSRSCGDPWTFHYDKKALQQHIRSWFADPAGLPYGKWGSIVNVLGIETVNEIIQVYKIKHEQLELAGDPIRNRATFFRYCRNLVEQGMEARENPSDGDAAWAALKPQKISRADAKRDDRSKYLDEYNKRSKGR
tara:strand:+ start:381 stop:971 length:591 start_codon:yes stop_codon:yes gene_type:complete